MIRIAVNGAAGRMGGRLIAAIQETEGLQLTGALEHQTHDKLGQDAGSLAGCGPLGVIVCAERDRVLQEADILIDFTFPEVSLQNLAACARLGKGIVIGSTGFTPEQRAEVEEFAQTIPVVLAPNMSVGVNACFKILKDAAKVWATGSMSKSSSCITTRKRTLLAAPPCAWAKSSPMPSAAIISVVRSSIARECAVPAPMTRSACRRSAAAISSASIRSISSAWGSASKSRIAP
jgi:hypothetical protein